MLLFVLHDFIYNFVVFSFYRISGWNILWWTVILVSHKNWPIENKNCHWFWQIFVNDNKKIKTKLFLVLFAVVHITIRIGTTLNRNKILPKTIQIWFDTNISFLSFWVNICKDSLLQPLWLLKDLCDFILGDYVNSETFNK